jgi:hypothetical protein
MKTDDGVSAVVSVMLILAVLVTAVAVCSATYVPEMKQNAEILHTEEIEEAFLRFSSDVDSLYSLGKSAEYSETFVLGGGDILLSPSKSSGTLRIQNISLGELVIGSYEPISISTVNVTYVPSFSTWDLQGYKYEKGLVWVTKDTKEIPALLSIYTKEEGKTFSENHVNNWTSTMSDSIETGNNTVEMTIINLYADPDADFLSGSANAVLGISAKKMTESMVLNSGGTIRYNNITWFTAVNATTVTLNTISGKVSAR